MFRKIKESSLPKVQNSQLPKNLEECAGSVLLLEHLELCFIWIPILLSVIIYIFVVNLSLLVIPEVLNVRGSL